MTRDRAWTGAPARPAEQSSAAHSAGDDSQTRGRGCYPGWLRQAAQVFVDAIREVLDESAYARFLSRTQMDSSPQAYAAFRSENEVLKARRPRCC